MEYAVAVNQVELALRPGSTVVREPRSVVAIGLLRPVNRLGGVVDSQQPCVGKGSQEMRRSVSQPTAEIHDFPHRAWIGAHALGQRDPSPGIEIAVLAGEIESALASAVVGLYVLVEFAHVTQIAFDRARIWVFQSAMMLS